jgi:hypothetical protein
MYSRKGVLLHNESIKMAPPGPNADSEAIMSHLDEALRCDGTNWEGSVLRALSQADLAVFHWATPPTRNMLWEFEQAQNVLPTRIVVHQSESSWDLSGFLQTRFLSNERPHIITIGNRYVMYAKPFSDFMRKLTA